MELPFCEKGFVDSERLLDTADLGMCIAVKLPKDYGEAMLVMLNGPGYTKSETDKFKDINPRITLVPLPKNEILKSLSIFGYCYLGKRIENGKDLDRDRMRISLAFTNSLVNLGGEFDISNDQKLDKSKNVEDVNGMGFSTFGELKFAKLTSNSLKKMGFITRFDSWDPNTNIKKDAYNVLLAGFVYTVTKNIRSSINLQQIGYEDSKIETAKRISCQAEVKL